MSPHTKWALRTHWMLSCDVVFFALLWFLESIFLPTDVIQAIWRIGPELYHFSRCSFMAELTPMRGGWGWWPGIPLSPLQGRNWVLFPWELQFTGKQKTWFWLLMFLIDGQNLPFLMHEDFFPQVKRKRWSNLSPMVFNEAMYFSVDISKN